MVTVKTESESCSVVYDRLFVTPWTIQSMEFSRPEYWSGQPFPSPEDLPNPGVEPRSPILQTDSLPAESQGKPKNTGVDSLSLLQGIFPTQEQNSGLLHCRWILYQLSYFYIFYLCIIYTHKYIYYIILYTYYTHISCNTGDLGSILGSEKSPEEGNGNPLQYSCLERPHEQRSLADYSPWCCKESDMTEQLSQGLQVIYQSISFSCCIETKTLTR